MADLIKFPDRYHIPDAFPGPGAPYQAYALPTGTKRFMLALCFPDGSITSYRFSDIKRMEFAPASSADGFDVLQLRFSWPWAAKLATVRIEGRNLLDLVSYVAQELTHWLWMLPADQMVNDPTAPVITRIVLPSSEI